MFRMAMLLMVAGGLTTMALWGPAQPPGEGNPGEDPKGPPPKGQKGSKDAKGPKGEGKFGGARGKGKGFQPGTVIPPHIVEDLDLTEEQAAAVKELEKDVRGRLEKILKPEQIQKIRDARPPMGGPGGPPGGFDGPPGAGRGGAKGPPGGNRPARPGADDEVKTNPTGGIQWFSTWQSAKAEAARTGRPILLVSAAPHCAGIPGIW